MNIMEMEFILNFLYEIIYFLVVFGIFMVLAIFKGRQTVMNIIVGLYLALLISIEFPGYDKVFGSLDSTQSLATGKLLFFIFITALTTALCYRIMPSEFLENRFESIFRKFILAFGATILVMIFSFHVLPVGEFMATGTPLQSLFSPQIYFFWWLLVPLVILYIV